MRGASPDPGPGQLDLTPYRQLSEALMKHTEETMSLLQRYCKLVENPPEAAISKSAPATSVPPEPQEQAKAAAG